MSFVGDLFGGSSGTTTVTQDSSPWVEVQRFLADTYGKAHDLYQKGGPDRGPSDATNQAIQMLINHGNSTGNAGDIARREVSQFVPQQFAEQFSPYLNPKGNVTLFNQGTLESLNKNATGRNLDPTQNAAMQPAINQLVSTLGGGYLDVGSNPYLRDAVQQGLDQTASTINSQFNTGDNYGGSAHQEWLGRGLADRALPIYANAYQQERQNQLGAATPYLGAANQLSNLQQQSAQQIMGSKLGAYQAGAIGANTEQKGRQLGLMGASMLPGLENVNIQPLLQAGQMQEGYARGPYESDWENLRNYSSLLGPHGWQGGQSSSQKPYFTNPLASAIGLGLGGLGLYNGLEAAGLLGGGAEAVMSLSDPLSMLIL